MDINVAKNAGFCFGVKRAIETIENLVDKGFKVCTLGDIINNSQVVDKLKSRGVRVISSLKDLKPNEILVIRSHGVTKDITENIKSLKIKCVDATCPFVKKIHNVVEKNSENKKFLLIAGKASHPEVVGIRSYFSGRSYIFSDLEDLKKNLKQDDFHENGFIVSQTTFSSKKWESCINFIKKHFTNIAIYDTICNVTSLRQKESEKLSKMSDLIIIVGGYMSSNTNKLKEICSQNTNVIHVENEKYLSTYNFKNFNRISITAGASTPVETIFKVKNEMIRLLDMNSAY